GAGGRAARSRARVRPGERAGRAPRDLERRRHEGDLMATITLTKTPRTIVASTSNAAGATTRGTVDLRTAQGGVLTMKITNGASGPTAAPTATVSIAHNAGATPAAAAEGSDWKRFYQFAGDTT